MIDETETKLVGASGIVEIIAPFPKLDTTEKPIVFYAVTRAKMLEPHVKLNGVAIRSVIKTEHFNA